MAQPILRHSYSNCPNFPKDCIFAVLFTHCLIRINSFLIALFSLLFASDFRYAGAPERCAMRSSLWLFVLFLSTWAASQECTTFVVVAALDHETGEELDTLQSQDFHISIGSKPVEIISATRPFNNRLLILVETDGAADSDKLADTVELITRFAREAPEGKPIAFGAYADRAVFTKGFLSDPKERGTAINTVIDEAGSLGKRVALMDSLHKALSLFGRHQAGDTVLLVADPFDDYSKESIGDIEKEFLASGTRLSVMLRQQMSRVARDFLWTSHEREKKLLENLSARTGGAYTNFGTHLFRFPWKGYMLGLKLPDGTNHLEKWNIQLRRSLEISRMHPKLYYPERLLPCGAEDTDR
jgi:hypothetical protein